MKDIFQIIALKLCFLLFITDVSCSRKDISDALKDTIAPSIPNNLNTSEFTKTSFTLSWTGSTDNVGVSGYEVFINGLSPGITDKTSMSVSGLTEGTTYKTTVRACDSCANWSAQNSVLNAITRSDIDRPVTHGSQLLLSDVGTSGTLTPSGSITTSYAGQIIENLIIKGNIIINHNNVIVRNCKIMHGNGLDGVVISDGSINALISHCEMDALSQIPGNYGSMGVVVEGNATVIRCYMHNVRSGMSILNSNGFGSFIENGSTWSCLGRQYL